jgi:alkylation response protein AidB-like acyl-CoA dehydrogenase
MRFVLNDVFKANDLWASMSRTREVTADLADAILEEAAKLTEGLLAPLNRSGDEEECQWDNGVVTTPRGFKEAYKTYAENGWTALSGNPEFGGQGMPKMLSVLFEEMLHAANTSFALYPILSNGATLAIDSHASEELKQTYLPKIYSGEWTGTMCLTEPHCGTDLGILRTKAVSQTDGSYAITGTKIFITGGDHDLVENIIHLVLAKLPDAPKGSKGISLFLVPKFLLDENGNRTERRNGVSCGSIEHKMGIKGSATCVMNFDNAKGWLVGEINNGLACMFTMMNYERLSIGLQGVGLGEVSYQNAAIYARERLQGRAVGGAQNPEGNADPLLVHGDIRRMLLTMRAINEGARALAVYVGSQLDQVKFSDDESVRKHAADRVELLTPVCKSFFTDRGFDNTVMGQQCFGGHGYIREHGMEQFVRDARIAQIYEGTNGIQALDLAGRKVTRNGGKLVAPFLDEIDSFIAGEGQHEVLNPVRESLSEAVILLREATNFLIAETARDANAANALAVEYLDIFGYVTYAWLWAKMMVVAADQSGDFFATKVQVGYSYFERLLPRVHALSTQLRAGCTRIMALPDAAF